MKFKTVRPTGLTAQGDFDTEHRHKGATWTKDELGVTITLENTLTYFFPWSSIEWMQLDNEQDNTHGSKSGKKPTK